MLAVVLLAVVLAGCGSTTADEPPSPTPEPTATGTAPAGLGAYLEQAGAVLADVGDTLAALPEAVRGINRTPDESWSEAGQGLRRLAEELADEASRLADLRSPSGLRPVQDAVVRGLQRTQARLEQTADRLSDPAQREGLTRQDVEDEVDQLRSDAGALSTQLREALDTVRGAL